MNDEEIEEVRHWFNGLAGAGLWFILVVSVVSLLAAVFM